MTKSLTQWQRYIGTSLRKTAEATLETAKRIAEYRETTKEDDFNKHMKEWFNFSPSHLSYWTKINEALPRFQENIDKLPSSMRTLYELSNIKDDLWQEMIDEGKLSPSLTVEGVKQFKVDGNALKKLSEKYSDADNYLEIMQAAAEMRAGKTKQEFQKEFDKWIKENPPEYTEEVKPIDGDLIPKEMEGWTEEDYKEITGQEPEYNVLDEPLVSIETVIDNAIQALALLAHEPDTEKAHVRADDVLCDVLEALGYIDLVKAYSKVEKWHA